MSVFNDKKKNLLPSIGKIADSALGNLHAEYEKAREDKSLQSGARWLRKTVPLSSRNVDNIGGVERMLGKKLRK